MTEGQIIKIKENCKSARILAAEAILILDNTKLRQYTSITEVVLYKK